MTIRFVQRKLEAHEQQAKGATTAAVKAVVEALLEAEVSAKLDRFIPA